MAASTSGHTTWSDTRARSTATGAARRARPRRARRSAPSRTAGAAWSTTSGRAARRRRPASGEPQPAGDVEDDAGAAREREHDEAEPHEVGLDVEVLADAARHPRDELAVGPAAQAVTAGAKPVMRAGDRDIDLTSVPRVGRACAVDDRTAAPNSVWGVAPEVSGSASGSNQGDPRWTRRRGPSIITGMDRTADQ